MSVNSFKVKKSLVLKPIAQPSSPEDGELYNLGSASGLFFYDGSSWSQISDLTSPLTTKGDVWTYSTVDARLAVGTNGQVLTADSTQALGIKWAAAGGGGTTNVTSVNSAYTTLDTDNLIEADAATGSFAVTLLTAVGNDGLTQTIKKVDTSTNTITINTTSSQTYDGRASGDIVLTRYNDFATFVSNGANWSIISKNETEFLNNISSGNSVASFTSNTYASLTGNDLSLGPGKWRIRGLLSGFGGGGTNVYFAPGTGFYGANGTNSGTPPTALGGVISGEVDFSSVVGGLGVIAGLFSVGAVSTSPTTEIIVSFDTTTSVYLVPVVIYTTSGGSVFTLQITAERLW